jgi:tRNA-dihydrouridine synthase B
LTTICLAPIQGTTDRIFRNLFPQYFHGVDYAIAPFVSATGKLKPDFPGLFELSPDRNQGLPTVPQIMGTQPENFVLIANRLFEMGCAVINWNLGCPFRMVVKKGRGAGMLCYPDRIESFLDRVMPQLKPNLSVKLRIGLKDPDDALALIPIFNRYPLEELIIHPRTGAQMYEGKVDLDRFEQCLSLSKHRVVYNGDIVSPQNLEALARRFLFVNRWMIGRGLMENPFLAEEIKAFPPRSFQEKVHVLKAFHDHLFAEYSAVLSGPGHKVNKMKEIWTFMTGFFENRDKVRKMIHKTHSPDHYLGVVQQIFDQALSRPGATYFPD